MGLILNIESATEVCSVSLARDGELIALKENTEGQQHAKLLTVFVKELFEESNISIKKLDAVAVSKGPGSYTGLRIGVSVAKGIAYAGNIPLMSVCTLQALAFGVARQNYNEDHSWFCPMIDARRMEVYTAFYDSQNKLQKEISADIIDVNSYQDILKERTVFFFGNGSGKCRDTIQSPNARFIENIICSAKDMIQLSHVAFQNNEFEDVAYFEPFYLKDFIATVPKKLF